MAYVQVIANLYSVKTLWEREREKKQGLSLKYATKIVLIEYELHPPQWANI